VQAGGEFGGGVLSKFEHSRNRARCPAWSWTWTSPGVRPVGGVAAGSTAATTTA
jgi:hypothetical protein